MGLAGQTTITHTVGKPIISSVCSSCQYLLPCTFKFGDQLKLIIVELQRKTLGTSKGVCQGYICIPFLVYTVLFLEKRDFKSKPQL